MAKIRFEDGTVVNFEGTPTPEDVEYVYSQLKGKSSKTNQEAPLTERQQKVKQQRVGQDTSGPSGIEQAEPFLGSQTAGNVGMTLFGAPAASSREAIRSNPALALTGPLAGLVAQSGVAGEGAKSASTRGALRPTETETFQEQFIRKGQSLGQESPHVAVNFMKGIIPSAAGLAADILTSPTEMLAEVVGAAPQTKKLIESLIKTKAGEATIEFINKPILGRTKKVEGVIDNAIEKSVRPSSSRRKTATTTAKSKELARDAVQTIVDNQENLVFVDSNGVKRTGLPQNLDEFSQAIDQTKRQIFDNYYSLLDEADEAGGTIDFNDIASELKKLSEDKIFSYTSEHAAKYADNEAELLLSKFLDENGKSNMTLKDAERIIQDKNQKLKAYYNNSNEQTFKKNTIDALIANRLRSKLDDSVNKITGSNYQALKNKYGALRSIEDDVGRSATNFSKQPEISFVDFSNIFAVKDIVQGRPWQGAAQIAAKNYLKHLKNPNRKIAKMFNAVSENTQPQKKLAVVNKLLELSKMAPKRELLIAQPQAAEAIQE